MARDAITALTGALVTDVVASRNANSVSADGPGTGTRRWTSWRLLTTVWARGRPVTVLVWVTAALAVVVTAWQPDRGIDPTDEASYLQAVTAPNRSDAFNGFFGLYLRPLWALAGWDVAAVRVLGLAVLLTVSALVGWATARTMGSPAPSVVAMTVAAGTSYYATSWRTPSYNWLAVTGAGLVVAGLLRLRDDGRASWGAVSGLGVAVAATGKLPTAAVLALLVVILTIRRRPALLGAAGVLAVAVTFHLIVMLDAASTLRVLQRTATMLGTVSPDAYTATGAMRTAVLGARDSVILAVEGGGLLGLMVLAAVPRSSRRASAYRLLCPLMVTATGTLALATATWSGGLEHLGSAVGVLPLLVAILVAGAVSGVLELGPRGPRRHGAAVALLVLAAGACVVGSNLAVTWQLTTVALVLAPACLLACSVLPTPGREAAVTAVVAVVSIGSLVTSLEARRDRRRSAPLAVASAPVVLAGITVRTDDASVQQLAELNERAVEQGWRPGTPFVDTTFTPAVPLALRGRVPSVLLPAFPGYPLASVCVAVRGLGPQWRDAWLAVLPTDSQQHDSQLAGYLGRQFPRDYVTVVTISLTGSYPVRVLRPRLPAGAAEAEPGPSSAPSCLGR